MKVNTSVRKIKDMIENWRAQDFFKEGGPWRKRIWNPLYKRVSSPPPPKKNDVSGTTGTVTTRKVYSMLVSHTGTPLSHLCALPDDALPGQVEVPRVLGLLLAPFLLSLLNLA